MKWCEENQMADVCGWSEIQACGCDQEICKSYGYEFNCADGNCVDVPLPENTVVVEGDIPSREDCAPSNLTASSSRTFNPSSYHVVTSLIIAIQIMRRFVGR